MPEFDVESVARMNKFDKVKLDILNRRQSTIDAYKDFQKYKNHNRDGKGLDYLKIELSALYIEVKQMIVREIGNERVKEGNKEYKTIEEIENDLDSIEAKRVLKVFNYIESLLYQKKITQLDTRETIDTTDIHAMNRKNYY